MTEVITVYIGSLMHLQSTAAAVEGSTVPPPLPRFPSFDHFCAEEEPSVSIAKYTERLVTYVCCTPEAFIYAMAYMRRLLYKGCPIHSRSVHRLLLCAVVVAAKTRDDHYWSMQYYAQVGGVTVRDLNGMELRFLSDMIDFRAEVQPAEYREVLCAITSTISPANRSSSNSQLDEACSPCDISRSSTPTDDPASSPEQHVCACPLSPPAWSIECNVFWYDGSKALPATES